MASSDRFVVVGEEEILYIISNIFAKAQVFYYLMFDAKLFDIIYLTPNDGKRSHRLWPVELKN
jgi:hypothetical protein